MACNSVSPPLTSTNRLRIKSAISAPPPTPRSTRSRGDAAISPLNEGPATKATSWPRAASASPQRAKRAGVIAESWNWLPPPGTMIRSGLPKEPSSACALASSAGASTVSRKRSVGRPSNFNFNRSSMLVPPAIVAGYEIQCSSSRRIQRKRKAL